MNGLITFNELDKNTITRNKYKYADKFNLINRNDFIFFTAILNSRNKIINSSTRLKLLAIRGGKSQYMPEVKIGPIKNHMINSPKIFIS